VAVGDLGPAGLDALRADLAGQFLRAHLPVAVHEDDEGGAGLVLHDQRLDDGVLVHAQLPGADAGAAMLLVAVEVLGVGDARLLQQPGRLGAGGLGHRRSIGLWQHGAMVRDVVVAGGTGEVGRQLLARLSERPELRVRALVRRPGLPVPAPNLQEEVLDLADEAACRRSLAGPCDLLIIAVGTTRAKAGSPEAFLAVDRDLPLRLVRALAEAHPQARVGLVSSVGADRPRGLYLRAKAGVEAGLAATGLAHAVARPSLLVSRRREFRPGEWLVLHLLAPAWLALGRTLFPRSRGWWRWAPVHVREVAESLLMAALSLQPGERRILESLDLHPGPVPTWGKP
jgi:uncharacterized protein YbjT (DUF2867 family)